jgi:hypothetical protein
MLLVFLPWEWAAAFLGGAMLLGLFGSLIAVAVVTRRH